MIEVRRCRKTVLALLVNIRLTMPSHASQLLLTVLYTNHLFYEVDMYEGNSKFNFLPHILREACEDAKTADKTSKT